jgi:hypothetical protein
MEDKSASEQIDDIIRQYSGWKGENIARLRAVIMAANPDIFEEVKWKMPSRPEGLPVWSNNGILCILETFKNDQKLVFFKGAFMKDRSKLFNARLKSSTDRAIEFHEGDSINETALTALVTEAVHLNSLKAKK